MNDKLDEVYKGIDLESDSVKELIEVLKEYKKELNLKDPFIIGGFIKGTTLTIYTTDLKILFDNIDVMNRYFNRIKSIPAFAGITDLHFDKILPYII